MLTIRLTRKGKKNQPFFRIVVVDKRRSAKGGRAVEVLGFVDPLTKKRSIKKERALYWISKGAQPSATIHNMLVVEKIIEAKKINKSKNPKKKEGEAAAAPAAGTPASAAPAAEAPVAEAPKAETPVPAPEAKPEAAPAPADLPAQTGKPAEETPKA